MFILTFAVIGLSVFFYLYLMTLKMKFKTREELLATPREELIVHERVAQSTLKENPDMTLEEVEDLLDMIP